MELDVYWSNADLTNLSRRQAREINSLHNQIADLKSQLETEKQLKEFYMCQLDPKCKDES